MSKLGIIRCTIWIGLAAVLSLASAGAYAQATNYKYDEFGRVVRVDHPNGLRTTYSYDAANNRTSVITAIPGSEPDPDPEPGGSNLPPTCSNWSILLNYPLPPYGPNTMTISPPAAGYVAHCSDSDGGTISVVTPSMPHGVTINRGETKYVPFTVSDGQGGTGGAVLTVTFNP